MEIPPLVVGRRSHARRFAVLLWVVQVLVALAFASGGVMKLAMPIAQLAAMWPWAGDLPSASVRLLGVVDLLGGLGVLLPSLTRIRPGVTVLAAAGCIALQVCAVIFHVARGELSALPVNLVLIAASVLVLWGRWKIVPVSARAT